jgi:branched-subunit amino acid aminotransferase/4-amino-4-deoxychorismate lyase
VPGLACYTGARASGGRVWHAERHARRLARDARLLGLGELDEASVLRLLDELAAPSRVGGELKIRIEAHRDAATGVRIRGAATALDPDRAPWRAIAAREPHPGASPTSRAKTTDRRIFEAALAAARAAGADEALFFDAGGFLVEGGRTSIVVVCADGGLRTPPLSRGGQAGIAREILLESVDELREADVTRAELASAREVVAVNAVRPARAVTSLDGHPLGVSARAGPWADRLGRMLSDG